MAIVGSCDAVQGLLHTDIRIIIIIIISVIETLATTTITGTIYEEFPLLL